MATQRNQFLLYDPLLPPKDKLELSKDEMFLKEIGQSGMFHVHSEKIMYSVDAVKINQRNYYQNRFICITTEHIFSMKSSNALSRIFSKKKLVIRRKLALKDINRIVYSSESDQFILGNQLYDLVYESNNRNDIIEYTLRSLHLSCPGQYSLPFYFVKDYGLNDVANHEHRPPLKKITEEPIVPFV